MQADLFDTYFANVDEHQLGQAVAAVNDQKYLNASTESEHLGKIVESLPDVNSTGPSLKRKRETENFASVKDIPAIKKRLAEPAEKVLPELKQELSSLAGPIFDYQDVLHGSRTHENAEQLRAVTALHALNHIYKTRDHVLRNNERLRASDHEKGHDPPSEIVDAHDQGFTRPKVLILLETRSAAHKYAASIVQLVEPTQQENKHRFDNEFDTPDGKPPLAADLPPDHKELFEGNDDNHFLTTLKFTRKTLKFYAGFYDSDVILASPLGLRRAINKKEKKDYDFLSSIEILIIDQAHAMLKQNFEHVEFVCKRLNHTPRDSTRADYSRVRPYYLDGLAKHVRQTLVYSAYLTPTLNRFMKEQTQSVRGRLKVCPSRYLGSMMTAPISTPIRQTFYRISSHAASTDPDARFQHFTSALLPQVAKLAEAGPKEGALGVMIFIPDAFDFVRVRHHLKKHPDALPCEFAVLDEYADVKEARRARSYFVSGRAGVLLYSGRAHHFRRYKLKGVKRAIIYNVPEDADFYSEILAMIGDTIDGGFVYEEDARVSVLYSKWEIMALERVVGSKRVSRMCREGGADTFDFK